MKTKLFIILIITLAFFAVATARAQTTANKFTEREVTFAGAGGLELHGTLVLPSGVKGKAPGVLLLSGSGPTDRNGNAPPNVIIDLQKEIAEKLAAEGYASLRYDKRARPDYFRSWPKDDAALADFFSWDNFVGDARAALAFLQTQREINAKQTLVAGHSEGAMFAIQLAHDLEGKPNALAGLILLSSPGRNLGPVLTEQIDASLKRNGATAEVAKSYHDYVQLAINQITKERTVPPNLPKDLAPLFSPSSLKLWQAEFTFDPPKLLSGYSGPVLVMQGEKDIQVSPVNDFPLLQAALKQRKHGTYKAVVVLSASHNLKKVENENAESGFTGPVVTNALDNISDWLKQTLKR